MAPPDVLLDVLVDVPASDLMRVFSPLLSSPLLSSPLLRSSSIHFSSSFLPASSPPTPSLLVLSSLLSLFVPVPSNALLYQHRRKVFENPLQRMLLSYPVLLFFLHD